MSLTKQNWNTIKSWAKNYFPEGATKAVLMFVSEYNDEYYDVKHTNILLFDKDDNELVPLHGKSIEARNNAPALWLFEEELDNCPEDMVVDLTQYVKTISPCPINHYDREHLIAWARTCYPKTAKKLVLMIHSEYNDNTFDNKVSHVIVFDEDDNELVLINSIDARKNQPDVDVRCTREEVGDTVVIEL